MIREKSRNVRVNFRGYTVRMNGIMIRKELTCRIIRERGDREMAEHWKEETVRWLNIGTGM